MKSIFNKYIYYSFVIVTCIILTNCSGGIFDSEDQSTPQIFKTKVIDGYISGANVFIDINWNLKQDLNEPSAYEDTENEIYYFEESQFSAIDNWSISCSQRRPRVAEVPVGAIDSSRGVVSEEYEMYFFPYQAGGGDQGESRANVTPLTSIFISYISSSLDGSNISDIDGCGQNSDAIANLVIPKVENTLSILSANFNISAYSFYEDFIASGNAELQAYAELIVDFLKTATTVSKIIEDEYEINLRTQLDQSLIQKILSKEEFSEITFALFSQTELVQLDDDYEQLYIYGFYDVTANKQGKLIDNDGNEYELNISNLLANTNFRIRDMMITRSPIFGNNKVLLEFRNDDDTGINRHIDIGTFVLGENLMRISTNNEKREINKYLGDGYSITIKNDNNSYFDYEFERIFTSRDPNELEEIYNEVMTLDTNMETMINNRYLLFDGDSHQLRSGDWGYVESNVLSSFYVSCFNISTNESVTGSDGYELCSQNIQ